MARNIAAPKKGMVVRYGGGSTALAQLTDPHAGGWHARQCMGGITFITGPFYELDEEDKKTWAEVQTKNEQRWGKCYEHLEFGALRKANIERCNSAFFPLLSKDGPWWGNAMAGECGEACNIIKKIDRDGDSPELHAALAKELADVVTYADLLAARFGIDLGKAVIDKFNEVSERRGSLIKL